MSPLSDEQTEFRQMVRRFLEERAPMVEVRAWSETAAGFDDGVWKQMTEELGLAGVTVPESLGGQGFGWPELAIVLRELGRALTPAPCLGTVGFAQPLIEALAPEPERSETLRSIASGSRFALGLAEPGGSWAIEDVATIATPDASGAFHVTGEKTSVLDGHVAETLLVVAREPGSTGRAGLGLFRVAGDARGVERRRQSGLDLTRPIAQLRLDGAVGASVGGGNAVDALERGLDHARLALCCDMLGGMEAALEAGVRYARERVQFSRVIGSFQAVKHQLADAHMALEAAQAAVDEALWAREEAPDQFALLVRVAQVLCSDAFPRVAHTNVQVHGGVGFTWEYDAHLYLRRGKSSALLLGDASVHREAIARAIGL